MQPFWDTKFNKYPKKNRNQKRKKRFCHMWLDQTGTPVCTQTNFTAMYNRRSDWSQVKIQNIFSFLPERPSVLSFLGAGFSFTFFLSDMEFLAETHTLEQSLRNSHRRKNCKYLLFSSRKISLFKLSRNKRNFSGEQNERCKVKFFPRILKKYRFLSVLMEF